MVCHIALSLAPSYIIINHTPGIVLLLAEHGALVYSSTQTIRRLACTECHLKRLNSQGIILHERSRAVCIARGIA